MDLSFSKEDLTFRDEVRRFIDENYDDDLRTKNAQSKNNYLDKDGMLKWQRALYRKIREYRGQTDPALPAAQPGRRPKR